MSIISMKQSEKYIANGGNACPLCGAPDIEGGELSDRHGGHLSQHMTCERCGGTWWDVYKLVAIGDDDT